MELVPPRIAALYTPEVLAKLRAIVRPPIAAENFAIRPFHQRHQMFSGEDLREGARALRAAWWAYIGHAAAIDLLDDDLRQRLTGTDDDNFRGALAECNVSWFFWEKLGLKLRRRHDAESIRRADFETEGFGVEVKSPCVPILGGRLNGDDAQVLRKCVTDAGRQLRRGSVNLVVVVPLLRTQVAVDRDQLVTATIGKWALAVPFSLDPEIPPPPPSNVFLQTGKLAKLFPTGEGAFRTDFTRVSAVVTIEEGISRVDGELTLEHHVCVVHNPFAPRACRLGPHMFAAFPQLLAGEDGQMSWSDGKELFP